MPVPVPIVRLRKPKQPVAGCGGRRFIRLRSGQRLVCVLPEPPQCRASWLFLSMRLLKHMDYLTGRMGWQGAPAR